MDKRLSVAEYQTSIPFIHSDSVLGLAVLVEFATGADSKIVKFFCLLSAMKCFIMVNKRDSEQSDDFT